jgi:tetratricopeptide (TPR) repeat protein
VDQGDFAGARPIYERALAIYEKAFGREHPDTAMSLVHLAIVLQELGRPGAARPLIERAVRINEKALGFNAFF